ncbi:MAG: acyl-CoA dehydrogenase family protein, partial [Cyclobacteriaceae bacterium]
MDIFCNQDHDLIRSSVRDFAEQVIKPQARKLDQAEEFSVELTRQMGDLGIFGMIVPARYGGHGMDILSYIIAVEEIARIDGSQAATVAAHNSLGIGPIYKFGTKEQKEKYLPDLCSG